MSRNTVWDNQKNKTYYDTVDLSIQTGYAVRGGLSDHCDLKQIQHLVESANSILEVGAGYGRVLEYLIDTNYPGDITAIELSDQFFQTLAKYQDHVKLLHGSVLDETVLGNAQYDLILWLWSGISDFTHEEQKKVIHILTRRLVVGGTLVVEVLAHDNVPLNAVTGTTQSYVIKANDATLYGYIPSPQEIVECAQAHEDLKVTHHHYQTDAGRNREMHFIRRVS